MIAMSAAANIPELIRRTRIVPGVIPARPGSDVRIDPMLFRITESEARTLSGRDSRHSAHPDVGRTIRLATRVTPRLAVIMVLAAPAYHWDGLGRSLPNRA